WHERHAHAHGVGSGGEDQLDRRDSLQVCCFRIGGALWAPPFFYCRGVLRSPGHLDVLRSARIDLVVRLELAAETGHADELAELQLGRVDSGARVDEDLYRAGAVVHLELVAKGKIAGHRLADGPHYPDDQPLGDLADRAGVDPP